MDSQMVNLIIIVYYVFQFLFISVVVDSKSITLSLSRHKHSSSKREELQRLVRASSARAQSFQQYDDNIPLIFPRSYGGYSLSLSFGTPLQTLSYIMDTGSSLTWFPCTSDFKCEHCDFKGTIRPFIPENSSSSETVPCNSTQCKYPKCTSQQEYLYCGYDITYGLGETMGSLLSEILTFPDGDETRLDNFAVGCSDYAYGAPSGIAGFGRGSESLPSQMELDSFSYCMVSHDFDDNITISSDLVLITKGGGGGRGSIGEIVHYTPFIDNPNSGPDYYYVRLQNITVGNVSITVPDEYQIPDVHGNGGTVVDSGTSLTVIEESVFDLVAKEFESQIIGKNNISNSRNTTVEKDTGLELCLNVWSLDHVPTLSLLFQGGVVMNLPKKNYFRNVEDSVGCLLMTALSGEQGPAIILGNYFQQNFYVEFDLKNSRLGLLESICNEMTKINKI